MEEYKQKILAEVEAHDRALIFNISQVIQGLLFSVVLKHENKRLQVGEVGNLIRLLVTTSFYNGPEGEEYPDYNHEQIDPIVERLRNVLKEYGIEPFNA